MRWSWPSKRARRAQEGRRHHPLRAELDRGERLQPRRHRLRTAAAGRSKPSTYQSFEQLVRAGVLVSLSAGRRNQSWEAAGLLELIAELEDGTWGAVES